MSKVWLITGSGSGLGRLIAEAALAAGDQVVATARNVDDLKSLAERHGPQVRMVSVDVTDEAQGASAVQLAVEAFGRLDVLVNNAGYGDTRPFEEVSSADFRKLVDTCFFGVVNLTRAALPVMRRQRSGHIIQISSLGARTAFPGNAAYFASKWAVGGFTESIAQEVLHLGIKVTALEPGAMRTNWGKRAHSRQGPVMADYEPSVGAIMKSMEHFWGNETGDPAKVAQVVLRVANADALPAHILLGSDAFLYARQAEQTRTSKAEEWKAITFATDFNAAFELPALPHN